MAPERLKAAAARSIASAAAVLTDEHPVAAAWEHRADAMRLLHAAVAAERARGVSWASIAEQLGVDEAAVRDAYGSAEGGSDGLDASSLPPPGLRAV